MKTIKFKLGDGVEIRFDVTLEHCCATAQFDCPCGGKPIDAEIEESYLLVNGDKVAVSENVADMFEEEAIERALQDS